VGVDEAAGLTAGDGLLDAVGEALAATVGLGVGAGEGVGGGGNVG
jgi:hypothetical protein